MIATLAAAYLMLPGHPQLPVHGVPLGPLGTVLLSFVVLCGVWLRRVPIDRGVHKVIVVVLAVLCVVRVGIGVSAAPTGWLARYYANDRFAGAPEWSSDFPRLAAGTRIDPAVSFKGDTFPLHYLNDVEFNRGTRRETSEPMSVEWNGFTFLDRSGSARVSLTARGGATLVVDGRVALEVSPAASSGTAAPHNSEASIELTPGPHTLSVRYTKPADVEGLIDLGMANTGADAASASFRVTPVAPDRASSGTWLIVTAHVVDVAVLVAFASALFLAVSARPRVARWGMSDAVTLAIYAVLGVQGWWKATGLAAGRVVTLSGGDDWFGFESNARDVLHHGPLMTLGQPPGQVYAYFSHPFYSYFLAGVHAVTGEGLFGPLFIHFLILATVAAIMFRLAAGMFGESAAAAGVLVLVAIMELDFARYYTVTLLSENLYILTVTLTVVPFIRWIQKGSPSDLAWTGFWGGMSSITRPAMMTYFAPALALIGFVSFRRSGRLKAALVSVAVAAAIWSATIAPITLRNLFVAHRLVLISDGLGPTFIQYNIPANADPHYYEGLHTGGTGGVLSGLAVLARMTWDYPGGMLRRQGEKLGFSLGMVQWLQGFRPHPELVAVSALYFAMLVCSKTMRSLALWPVHLFVLSHLAALGLTNPSNYGYRLILPPYVYTSSLSVAAAISLVFVKARPRAGSPPTLEPRA